MIKKKILITVFLISNSISGTPEHGDIIENPLDFSEWDDCFLLKKEKTQKSNFLKLQNGEQIKNLMRKENLKKIYFRDCELEKKWRKIVRTKIDK